MSMARTVLTMKNPLTEGNKMKRKIASLACAAVLVGSGISFAASPAFATTTCTYTQGYYKNHAGSLDNRYELVKLGITSGSSLFFKSDMTVQQILNSPSLGDPYLIAAKQYIATGANGSPGLTGFNAPGTSLAVSNAWKLLTAYFSNGIFSRSQVLTAADVLDQYNNGLLDIPHCG